MSVVAAKNEPSPIPEEDHRQRPASPRWLPEYCLLCTGCSTKCCWSDISLLLSLSNKDVLQLILISWTLSIVLFF
jgi:hypothetical protein